MSNNKLTLPNLEIETRDDALKILKTFHSVGSKKLENKFLLQTMQSICTAVGKEKSFFDIYCDIFQAIQLQPQLKDFKYFTSCAIYLARTAQKNKSYSEALAILQKVPIERLQNESEVRKMLEVYTKSLLTTFVHGKPDKNEAIAYFNNLTKLIEYGDKLDKTLLIEFTNTTFEETYVYYVIKAHISEAQSFIDQYTILLKNVTIPASDLVESFTKFTKVMISFLRHSDSQTLPFLKSLVQIEAIKAQKFFKFSLDSYYYLIRTILNSSDVQFNRQLNDILEKISAFLNHNETTEIWFMDAIVSFVLIFDCVKSRKDFVSNINETNFEKILKLMENLLKSAESVRYDKTFWKCCTSLRKHIIVKIGEIVLAFFDQAIKSNITSQQLGKSVCKIFKHVLKVCELFQCPNIDATVKTLINAFVTVLQGRNIKSHASHIQYMLDCAVASKQFEQVMDVIQLIKYYIVLYELMGNTKALVEMTALYVTHLIKERRDSDGIAKYVQFFYAHEQERTILDVLQESKSPYKLDEKDFKSVLLPFERDLCKKNSTLLLRLLKHCDSDLSFAYVAKFLPFASISNELQKKRSSIKAKLKSKSLSNGQMASSFLALGHICLNITIGESVKMKGLFGIKTYTNDVLNGLLANTRKLESIGVASEGNLLKFATEGLRSFERFFKLAEEPLDNGVEWDLILDDVSMLARIFQYRGFTEKSYECWKLVLRIATLIDDDLNQIRALSYPCENYVFVAECDPEFDFAAEIDSRSARILYHLENLNDLTPRRQNYVLICVMNIAYYYYLIGDASSCAVLMERIKRTIEELEERKNKFELVKATYYIIHFRIESKFPDTKISPYWYAHCIIEQMKKIEYVTSEDVINFPAALFGIVTDIAHYVMMRLWATPVVPYLQMIMKNAMEAGCAFRLFQILSIWANIDLQCEEPTKSEVKADLIDVLLGNRKSDEITASKKLQSAKCNQIELELSRQMLSIEIEPLRRAVKRTTEKKPIISELKYNNLDFYTHSSVGVETTEDFIRSCQMYHVGFLRARISYLVEDNAKSEDFYENAIKWWSKQLPIYMRKCLFKEFGFWLFIHYMNVLRRNKRYKTVDKIKKAALNLFGEKNGADSKLIDIAYIQNIVAQIMCSIPVVK